jgi:Reverse transcriptase (RNA-dependent DNA polymerase)
VLSDLLEAVDNGDYVTLVLLDLSAAFDTVDHAILLKRLQMSFGFDGAMISWFLSYLSGRSQYVRRGASRSSLTRLKCGFPQGSVLGQIFSILQTANLVGLIQQFGLHLHLYADDTQIYGSCAKSDVEEFQQRLSACTHDVATWMHVNRLLLNTDKTELLWCTTLRRLHQLPFMPIRIGPDFITACANVRDLGIYMECYLTMR